MVVDVNNDGQANIVVPANNRERPSGPSGIRVLASGGEPWMPTRTIWNQNAYHVDNINDDLSIPPQPIRYWETHNTFRLNAFPDRDALARSDLAIADLRVEGNQIVADILNRGEAPSQQTAYTLHLGEQAFNNGQVPVLDPGESHTLSIAVGESTLGATTRVAIELENRSLDCLQDNNRLDGQLVDLHVSNRFDLSDSQRFIVYRTNGENTAPVITAAPPSTTQGATRFNWTVPVYDPDVGDAHTFTLVDGPAGMSVGEFSGRVRWNVPLDVSGEHSFTIEVKDLSGATATGTWSLNVVEADYNAPPFFLTEPPTVANQGESYTYRARAEDDGDQLFWSLDEAPAGMTVDAAGQVHWPEPEPGEHTAVLRVTDEGGLHATQFWALTVNPLSTEPTDPADPTDPVDPAPNQPPSIQAELDATVQAGGEYRRPFRFSDPDGYIAEMQLQQAPQGMDFLLLDDSNPGDITGEIVWPVPPWAEGDFPVVVRITDDDGLSAEKQFLVSVIPLTVEPNLPPVISSTPVTRIYPADDYLYPVIASDPEGGPLAYRLESAPGGMTIHSDGVLTWPGPNVEGQYPVTVAVSDEFGNVARQSWTLRVAASLPPVFTTTPPLNHEADRLYQYSVGVSDPDGGPVALALVEAPAGMTLQDTLLQWPTTASDVGQHTVRLRATDSTGESTDQAFNLQVELDTNQPPEITSTPVTRVLAGEHYSYQATAHDPDGDPLTWQLDNGPAGIQLDPQQGLLTWQTGTDDAGQYPVELGVLDGRGGVAWQTFTLQVNEESTDPGDSPGPDIHSSAPRQAKVGHEYRYVVEASHPDGLTLQYSLEQAPAGATLEADGLLRWTPQETGDQAFALRVSDGQQWIQQSWTVSVAADEPLALTLDILPQPALINQPISIRLEPEFAAGAVNGSLQINGEPVTLDHQLTGEFTTATPGQYQLTASIDDGFDTAAVSATLLVRDPNATGGPEAALQTPAEGSEVTAPVAVTGSATGENLAGWRLSWRSVDDTGSGTLIGEGSGEITDSELGRFDPTLLINGQYQILLDVWDHDGLGDQVLRTVQVGGEMKIGHFSITFEDATVPLAGMPVSLDRTYDSRQRDRDMDFGHGWSFGYRNVQVQESRVPGLGWALNQYGSGLNVSYCVEPFGDPIVTVTLPGGELERFRARAHPECTQLVPQQDVELRFEPLAGTYSQLEQLEFSTVRVTSNNELINLSGDPSMPVDPDRYKLTLEDGTQLTLDQGFGIRQAREPSGNTLTFTETGITHSSGVGIQFVRNSQGRIQRVILPDGNDLSYSYSSEGDLISSTDAAGSTTTYRYRSDLAHYLEDILDPQGNRAIRNEYDADGRLIGQIDADGNRLEFDHNIDGRTQVIRDRRGNATVYVYDERGNVLSETNALGETTTRTYDELGNELTRTDPLGRTWSSEYDARGNLMAEIDPLGRVTRSEHNRRGQVLTQQAPDGTLVMQNAYDANTGNLLRTTDGEGNDTRFAYDNQGNLTRTTDALGNETRSVYDSRGNLIRQTDALGNVTEYRYDVMGNRLSETDTATGQVTHFAYDSEQRQIRVTDPQGNVSRTEYNAIGQVAAEINALGHRTRYEYDSRGNQTRIIHPDGSSEESVYDAENNLIRQTDALGRTTEMTYDAANRLTETRHPDGTTPRTVYDAAGQVIEEVDERGNRTTHSYDQAGQRLSTTDALGNLTRFGYDLQGRQISVTDARGHTTHYEYDKAGRRLVTRLPDGTSTQIVYDDLGRKLGEADPAGLITAFEYDPAGRLTAVIDPLDQRTEYGYDSQGNRLTQTDANGHTTTWAYDALNRPVSRTLPAGQSESYEYDAAGNRTRHTDFNGQAVDYQYDEVGRQTRIDYPDGSAVATTYTATGAVANVTVSFGSNCTTLGKQAGTTRYHYDDRDRLLRVEHPDGTEVRYEYDAAGNRTLVATPNRQTRYSFDALNRLQSATTCTDSSCSDSETTRYSYTPTGSRSEVIHANGSRTDYEYDRLNRLTSLSTRDSNGTVIHSQQFTLGAAGHRLRVEEVPQRTVDYRYDDLYRLTEEQVSDPRGDRVTSYSHDATGNRTSRTVTCTPAPCNGELLAGTTLYSYDANDRLLREQGPEGTSTYQYDASGNTVHKTGPEGSVSYHYDPNDRLIRATGSLGDDASTSSYTYDHRGIRQSQTVDGITTRYVTDSNRAYAQVLEEQMSSGTVTAYSYGDDRISLHNRDGSFTYHADGLGSVRALTDSSGTLSNSYTYEAFGETEHQTGSTENPFRYTGEQWDPNLGFYYLRARYYDPSSGRFPTMDTYQGRMHEPATLHKYLYVHGDPVNSVDPSGHMSLAHQMAVTSVLSTLASLTKAYVMVCTAEFAASSVVGAPSGAPTFGCRNRKQGRMRLQLQENFGKKRTDGDGRSFQDPPGVTSKILAVLDGLVINPPAWLPNSLSNSLSHAAEKMRLKIQGTVAAGGVFGAKKNFKQVLFPGRKKNESYRLDLDNEAGHNLRM